MSGNVIFDAKMWPKIEGFEVSFPCKLIVYEHFD